MRSILFIALLGCGSDPTPTGTVCPTPDPGSPTYASFGKQFMTDYCTWCHDSSLTRSARNGAPLYHDFDSLIGVLQVSNHVDEEAASGPNADNHFMPPERCPSTIGGPIDRGCPMPTEEERKALALWIACEVDRPHDTDAGVDAP